MNKPKEQTHPPALMLEEEYRQLFSSFPPRYYGFNTDEDSLEQPSALKYVPNTTSPTLVS